MYQLKSDDSADLNNQLREHIVAFNAAHFNAERIPLGFKFVNKQNSVVPVSMVKYLAIGCLLVGFGVMIRHVVKGLRHDC